MNMVEQCIRYTAMHCKLNDEFIEQLEQEVDNAQLWVWLSQNPSLFNTSIDKHMPKVVYNRIGHNSNLPMDVKFLTKWKTHICMSDVLNHPNATPDVKKFAMEAGAC